MSQTKEMREQRCKLIADAREIMDSTETLDAEQRSAVDNSPYDVGDNSQSLSLKYQRGVRRSLFTPARKQINAAMT